MTRSALLFEPSVDLYQALALRTTHGLGKWDIAKGSLTMVALPSRVAAQVDDICAFVEKLLQSIFEDRTLLLAQQYSWMHLVARANPAGSPGFTQMSTRSLLVLEGRSRRTSGTSVRM